MILPRCSARGRVERLSPAPRAGRQWTRPATTHKRTRLFAAAAARFGFGERAGCRCLKRRDHRREGCREPAKVRVRPLPEKSRSSTVYPPQSASGESVVADPRFDFYQITSQSSKKKKIKVGLNGACAEIESDLTSPGGAGVQHWSTLPQNTLEEAVASTMFAACANFYRKKIDRGFD